jgi:NAD(P)-dependent dehydrogenase (short-subunit alcohol dehydrogenase family)
MRLTGKIALVVGGTSGIGLAAVQRLIHEGAHVVALGRRVAEVGEPLLADVERLDDLTRAMDEIRSRHGHLDVLVIAAGVSNAPEIDQLDVAAYDALMNVNCRGATFAFVYALPILSRGASVVFVGSVGGRKGQPGDPLYAASKAFIRGFVRSAGTSPQLLARGIRVNTVAPGPIETPLTAPATADPAARAWVEERLVPMRRWGHADEVAAAIAFLASDDASFTTGAELTVDGGMAHV